MARGFTHAPGASPELRSALDPARTKAELLDLGASKHAVVREAVASRPDCPLGLMVTLAHDYSVDVRCAVAANEHAQRSVLQYLAADRSVDVLLAVIDNPALPEDLLDELAFHKKAQVRAAAAARLDTGAPVRPAHAEGARAPELMDAAARFADHEVTRMAREAAALAVPPAAGTPVDEPVAGGGRDAEETGAAEHGPAPFHHVTSTELGTRTAPVRGFRAPQA